MLERRKYSPREKQAIFVERIKSLAPDSWGKYLELVSHEIMSRDEIKELNFKRSVDILRYAYDNTVFYKRLYDASGFTPDDIKTPDDWDKVPCVTKDMVREYGDDFLVGGKEGEIFGKFAQMNSTGGSTGRPLKVYCDKRHDNNDYWHWRHRGWWFGRNVGVPVSEDVPVLGQNQAYVWRAGGLGMVDDKIVARQRRIFYPMRFIYMNAQDMSDENIKTFVSEVNEDGCPYIHAYTGAAQQLAELLIGGAITLTETPKVVSVTCTVLTEDCRRVVEKAFHAPLFDVYGCNETNWLAVGCRSDKHGLHVLDDLCKIDLIDDSGNAIHDERVGSVLATSFENKVSPFVKYALGDRTHFINKPCQCGLPFTRIASVQGRESDYLVDYQGRKIFGWNASFDADEYQDCVRQFQYEQTRPGEVVMRIVPCRANPRWNEIFVRFKTKWIDSFEGRLKFKIDEVDEIPHDGGKIRFIIPMAPQQQI